MFFDKKIGSNMIGMLSPIIAVKSQEDIQLFNAIRAGNISEINLWLSKGANPNGVDRANSFLHWAVYENKFEIVKILHAHGANVNSKNDSLATPLITSARESFFPIMKFLIEK